MKQPKIIVILLNWNGEKDTIECLFSLRKLRYPNFQPLVVDNGSKIGSVEKIRKAFPDTPILQTGENLGFAEGNNVGIRWALRHKAEWILLLNNDTVIDENCLSSLLEATREKPNGAIFGAKILRYDRPNIVDHFGGKWSLEKGEFISPDQGVEDHPYFEITKTDYVCGAALLMHRKVPETIGLLEPRYFLFWEESDFCFRAKRAGFEIWAVPEAKVWHKVSSSFSGGKPHMHYFWWRSRLLWIERNCTKEEKKVLYKRVVLPEISKMFRHFFLKSLLNIFTKNPKRKEQKKRLKAGCLGVLDYVRGKAGNCPKSLLR